MDLIHQNPFRTLGIPITATDREIVKSISDLSIFMKMGKTKEFDCDQFFPVKPHRTSESIENASQKIEQPKNKLFYALFWFWENPINTIDAMAFEELKNGNVDKAIQFWGKATSNGITTKNSSNHKNLAVLYMGLSSENGKLDKTMFLKSLRLSGIFFANGYFEEFINHVIGPWHSIDHLDIINTYVDEIISLAKPYLDKIEGLKTRELIKEFSSYPGEIQNVILDKFIGKYIHNIERQIIVAENSRNENVSEANKAGFELYEKTEQSLKYLRTVLSESDLAFQLSADKLANEITECAISYFNEFHGSETEPGDDALKLLQYAKSIAVGEKVSERIDEGVPIVREYVNEKPKREKLKSVKKELDYIYDRINNLQTKTTPSIAETFVTACRAKLNLIKDGLGKTDANYLEISDSVVNVAVGMCVDYLNAAVVSSNALPSSQKGVYLRGKLAKINPVFDIIEQLDMTHSTRGECNKLCTAIGRKQSFSNTPKGGGCYIATMVYGSYNAPEVMVLRRFRDEALRQLWIGRKFIKIYYQYSPSFVKKTKHLKKMHVILKTILEPFVNYLKDKDG